MSGDTPLHSAAQRSDKDVAELLIAEGADASAKNAAGRTPRYCASNHGMKKLLKKHGAKE